jgi:hypothetical protein
MSTIGNLLWFIPGGALMGVDFGIQHVSNEVAAAVRHQHAHGIVASLRAGS